MKMRRSILVWTIESDPEITASTYEGITQSAAKQCSCSTCRNFDAARPQYYPKVFTDILESVLIDPSKEFSVRMVAPLEKGFHLYAGTYLFHGKILAGRPYRGFPFLCDEVDVFERVGPEVHAAFRPLANPEGPWAGKPCIRFDFLAILPWVISDADTDCIKLNRQHDIRNA